MVDFEHWATSYALGAEDLYIKFPSKQFVSLYGEWEPWRLSQLYAKIFKYFFYIVIVDIIENRAMLKFPPGCSAWMEMAPVTGDDFVRARQNGAFQDVDFLASGFAAYTINIRFQNRYGKWVKRLYVSAKYRDRIVELTNKGVALTSTKIKNVSNYVEQVQQQFPILSKSELIKIIQFGLKRYAYANRNHCDVLLCNRTKSPINAFCGRLTIDTLKHYKQWHVKWRMKERLLSHLKKEQWDGYYYIGVDQKTHDELLKQKGKFKHFGNVYLVKIKKEFRHERWCKHIWRVPFPIDCGWKFFREDYKSDKAEYVEENDYSKYHTAFLK